MPASERVAIAGGDRRRGGGERKTRAVWWWIRLLSVVPSPTQDAYSMTTTLRREVEPLKLKIICRSIQACLWPQSLPPSRNDEVKTYHPTLLDLWTAVVVVHSCYGTKRSMSTLTPSRLVVGGSEILRSRSLHDEADAVSLFNQPLQRIFDYT